MTIGSYRISRMEKGNLWISLVVLACLLDFSVANPYDKLMGNYSNWADMPKQKDKDIDKGDLAVGLGSGFAALFLLMIIAVLYLKKSRSDGSSKNDPSSSIYVVLPNGQTVMGQKAGTNVTMASQNDLYALGSFGGPPMLPPRIVEDNDTYARIVESIYSTTPADKVLSIPMEDRKASTSTGSHYVRGFLGPSLVNPAYATYGSSSLLYGNSRQFAQYASRDALSLAGSAAEEDSIRQASRQPISPQMARSVSQNEAMHQEAGANEAGNQGTGEVAQDGQAHNVHGPYGPLPGPLLLRPVVDRGQVSYVLDAETGYRSRMLPPEEIVYVRDPESGYRSRVLAPGAQRVNYVYDPESGARNQAAQVGAEGQANRVGQQDQPSSGAAASADNANEQCHSGDSHDSQSSSASGASSSVPLASASVPMGVRPIAPRFGYAASHPLAGAVAAAAAAPEVGDVPTVIRRFNADTGEEYIYTLAVSRLPRTNVNR